MRAKPLLSCLLLTFPVGFYSPAVGSAGTDLYDDAFRDDRKTSSVNFIQTGATQVHSLASPDDEDWFVFVEPFPGQGILRTVKVEAAAAGGDIDPSILIVAEDGTTITMDVFSGEPGVHDAEGAGGDEVFTWGLNRPEPHERYFIRVAEIDHPAGVAEATTYTFKLLGSLGSSVGVGIITLNNRIGTAGGRLPEPGGRPAYNENRGGRSAGWRIEGNVYSQRRIEFQGDPTGVVSTLERTQWVTFSPPFDAYDAVKRDKATLAWHRADTTPSREHNYSIVMIHIGDFPLGETGLRNFQNPRQPATLILQLADDRQMVDENGTPTLIVDDAPDG